MIPPDGPCGRCGDDMEIVGRVHDGVPFCLPCSTCARTPHACAAWAVVPGGLCGLDTLWALASLPWWPASRAEAVAA